METDAEVGKYVGTNWYNRLIGSHDWLLRSSHTGCASVTTIIVPQVLMQQGYATGVASFKQYVGVGHVG
jgi:hypothetical protein